MNASAAAAAIAAAPLQRPAELSRLPPAERVPPLPSAFEVAAAHRDQPELLQRLGERPERPARG